MQYFLDKALNILLPRDKGQTEKEVDIKKSFQDQLHDELQTEYVKLLSLDETIQERDDILKSRIGKVDAQINERESVPSSLVNQKIMLRKALEYSPELKKEKASEIYEKIFDLKKAIQEIDEIEPEEAENQHTIELQKSEDEVEEKAMTTESFRPLIKEELEKKCKKYAKSFLKSVDETQDDEEKYKACMDFFDEVKKAISEVIKEEKPIIGTNRKEMPQISNVEDFCAYCEKLEKECWYGKKKAKDITYTQQDLNMDKVAKVDSAFAKERTYIISKDGYLLDGHHSLEKIREENPEVSVVKIGVDIEELLSIALDIYTTEEQENEENANDD